MKHVPLLAACVLLLAACKKEAPPPFELPPAAVVVATAAAQNVPLYLDEIGKCAARETVSIKPQVSGQITAIHFENGADLKPGDLLFTIDPRTFQADVDSTESRLAQAEVALELAKRELARLESVGDSRAVSQQDLDEKKSAVDAGAAAVGITRAAVATAKLDLERTSIRSPIEGRAGWRLVDLGNVVTANETDLLVIQGLDPVYAQFAIPENELTAVQRHMAEGTLRVEVRLPGEGEPPRTGKLMFLDNAVQGGTGTVDLRASVPNADRHLWPGRFLRVRLVLSTLEGAVLVPATAPQVSAQGPFVYVVKEDGTAELRPVTLGQRHADHVVIASGLAAGERVVVTGQLGVMPGGKVRIVEPPPAPAPPAPIGASEPPPEKTAEGGQ